LGSSAYIYPVGESPGRIDSSFYNVYVARKSRGQRVWSTLPQLTPIILFFAAHYAWLLSPYSHTLQNGGLMRVSLTMTFVFGRMTTKIILVPAPPPRPPSPNERLSCIGTPHQTTIPIFHKSHYTSLSLRHRRQHSLHTGNVRPLGLLT
jgi:hypothetical protein